MSWWVYLEDRNAQPWCSFGKEPSTDDERRYGTCPEPCYPSVLVAWHSKVGRPLWVWCGCGAGTGGLGSAEVNITRNYSLVFHEVIDGGLKRIHMMPAQAAIPLLEHAVDMLGTQRDQDYWNATRGNAGAALALLLNWAKQRPDATFRVS